jgi:hypothetical protein
MIGESLLGAPREFNWLVIALDIAVFRPRDEYSQACDALLDEIKSVPPATGFKEDNVVHIRFGVARMSSEVGEAATYLCS